MALRASGGMPLRPGDFPFLSLAIAHLTSWKVIGIDGSETWFLWDDIEDSVVDWYVVVENFVEMHAKY